ncbi:uncharacterized protein LOC117173065 [Belonocnema kinseyi]|uniref:uncharacterized protein LOC117173065 n=1 Tax=Belonocnema kinseyi TaxID=2817044 RepID=UPI00143DBD1F|nr:uncharacterized protein LOC117173065 [Belonocnema kinseyi]
MRNIITTVLIKLVFTFYYFELSLQSDSHRNDWNQGASSSKRLRKRHSEQETVESLLDSSSNAHSGREGARKPPPLIEETIPLGQDEQLIVHIRDRLVLIKINSTAQTVIPFKNRIPSHLIPYKPFNEYRIVGEHYEPFAVRPNVWITDILSYHCLYAKSNNHEWIYNKALKIHTEVLEIERRGLAEHHRSTREYERDLLEYGGGPYARRGF